MRIGILSANNARARQVAKDAVAFLRTHHPNVPVRTEGPFVGLELVVLVGDDRFFLEALREIDGTAGVLLIGDGFLAEVPPDALGEALAAVLAGRNSIEPRMRLAVTIGKEQMPPAFNEVALSTRRGAGFLRYTLEIDGDRLWRDGGDGVVVCTPTGSTGYGLSAGGPIVLENADAVVVVPVCSATGQRPLVVPSRAMVAITQLESRGGCEVILDGTLRARVGKTGFRIRLADQPIKFVRLGRARYLRIFGKLRERRAVPEIPVEAAPSAKFLFRLLSDQGPMTEKQLIADSGLPERTVRSALTYLVGQRSVRRSTSLRDAREAIFSADG